MTTVAEHIIDTLHHWGIKHIFVLPGAMMMPLNNASYVAESQGKLKCILVRHEQGAAHMADGYARAKILTTGKILPGVIIVTSGPGVTNTITGLYTAQRDSIPVLCFSGNVSTMVSGTEAFQECDVIALVKDTFKYSKYVDKANEIFTILNQAYTKITSGRNGAGLLDIPVNILRSKIEPIFNDLFNVPTIESNLDKSVLKSIWQDIIDAKTPVFIVGHGVLLSGATSELQKLVLATGVAVCVTLMGITAWNSLDYPEYYHGMVGLNGNPSANDVVSQADFILCLGTRMDERITLRLGQNFAPGCKRVVQVCNEVIEDSKDGLPTGAASFGSGLSKQIIKMDVGQFLRLLSSNVDNDKILPKTPIKIIDYPKIPSIKFLEVIQNSTRKIHPNPLIVTDVGSNQMSVVHAMRFGEPGTLITCAGFGTMGFGLPAAIGAKFCLLENNDTRPVICVAGDGGFQMTMQELAVIVEHNLNIKIIIINNQSLGMVKFFSEIKGDHRHMVDFPATNVGFFKNVARCYGITAESYDLSMLNLDGIDSIWTKIMTQYADKPYLLEIKIDVNEGCYPYVNFGSKSLTDMNLGF